MKKLRIEHSRKKLQVAFYFSIFILSVAFFIPASSVHAVPETTAVRVVDVTTSSFSIIWMTDVAADPEVELYAGNSLQQRITEGITVTPMPAGSSKAAEAARSKGIMKVRVSGLQPARSYYVRTVTRDRSNTDSVSYSALQQVTTAAKIHLFRTQDGTSEGFCNDLVTFPVYIRPSDTEAEPGLGDLIILEEQDGRYPVSAFAGDGIVSPEGVLDLNNMFGNDGASLAVAGNEVITLRVYRAGNLSTLMHYRKAPQNSKVVSVAGLLTGFFADNNLDGKIDVQDFQLFKSQYRSMRDDMTYNPDYNYVDDEDGWVDVREFSTFSMEYGRTDVE